MNKPRKEVPGVLKVRSGIAGVDSSRASVRMGEIAVVSNDGTAHALLGSCIGLAIFDRSNRIGGFAHVVLPDSRGHTGPPGKFVDTAIPELIRKIGCAGGDIRKLAAKITGGSRMFVTSAPVAIGEQNLAAVEHLLEEERIPVLGQHCGGTQGRRVTFSPGTGRVRIEIIGCDTIEI